MVGKAFGIWKRFPLGLPCVTSARWVGTEIHSTVDAEIRQKSGSTTMGLVMWIKKKNH
jgi:hypothetical protein